MADLPTIEGFRILEELGSGALCSVYAAIEEPLERKVALKVLKSSIPPTSPFAAQLEREARILANLCHPNIGLLHAFFKSDSCMFLVLEHIDGFSLATLLKRKPTAPHDSVAAIGAAVARGLQHAHELGIVHRDVKPANILVSRRGEVKVFDFGIAQRENVGAEPRAPFEPVRVVDVTAFGTPAYMSPEQILGEKVDARSDVFSLGIVLYQLVCGTRPFDREDGGDGRPAAQRIRRDPPVPLHRRAPNVSAGLERIVMRAIEKLPQDRFPTMRAMAEELELLGSPPCGLRGDRVVMSALEHAGLIEPQPVERPRPTTLRRRATSAKRAIAGLAALGGGAIALGALIQSAADRKGEAAERSSLALAPPSPGFVRVLATPWAEVWIDGERVDVTPFARAIALPAGKHYLKLVHPKAPVEKRVVDVVPGQTTTFEVVMAVSP